MSSHSSSMRTFRSSDSASEIGSSETSFSERSQPYFALCSPRSKSSVNVSNSGGVAAAAGPGSTVGGSSSMSSGINLNNNNNANSNINNFKQPAAQQPPAVAYHHQPCRRSSSAKAANKPRPVVRRDLGHVNSFPDAHHNMHHKTPPGGGSSSTSYYTPPRSPSLSVTTPTDGPPRRSPTTPSSSAVFKFPSSAGSAITASSSSGGSAIVHHYGRSGGTNPNTPRTLPRSPSTGSAATSTSYNTNSDSACNTHRSASDLTECTGEDLSTMPASVSRPSSPRGRGLAYLASRRSSRDSQFSNEELAPLNFNATARGRQRRTSNFLELPVPDHVRPRVCSLPEKPYNPRSGDELYRLRTFSITNKGGVVNCGDSIINRRSRSNTSVNSTTSKHSPSNLSGISPFDSSCCGGNSSYNDLSSGESSVAEEIPKYRVVLLGESGVGKTALVSQFMTSEYMNTYDASLDDEFGEKTVSILLDGEESEMVFIDHPSIEMSVENSIATYEPHACIVVYSVVSKGSFKVAEEILNYLWQENYTREKTVIVVGNKADLMRARCITTEEGKQLACLRECKFIETSSGIQHNVDELLVGVLKQIRLRETRDKKKQNQRKTAIHGSKTSLSLHIAKEILQKMCLLDSKSKSCGNLHVL
ncbi:probable serine/threonine-protein kinase nek3 [Metopolophium dirhodum]|uniref:probable serine/threonine-protein kinase nek3 n=1 Tax=Metopolophium dirhodum TaxID=44670 RepID=UPI0029900814|nr:probable serine/threonine-protein kinase nek3 [Metopolophium dirhodum]